MGYCLNQEAPLAQLRDYTDGNAAAGHAPGWPHRAWSLTMF
ncbi:hypothetical protein QFZ79_001124 [Arthrobacter sp. V4I6]|nr:hypothetical protein [Arthrobacter sp. V1I7]MDQ0853013.1 hypothetical protein [Arthrobacter sp. V4I6]